jgi:predicted N-acyltransferase
MMKKELWDQFQPDHNPFLKFEFFNALVESRCIDDDSGWTPIVQSKDYGLLINYVKDHSYGEYIFDWSWAEAFSKHGIPYYPKLTSMIPFTPVTAQHFLIKPFDEQKAIGLLSAHDEFFNRGNYSSSHFLFITEEEINVFKSCGYCIRESMQYHFHNPELASFDHFLSLLKTKKAKNILHERQFPGLNILQYTGDSLTSEHAKRMYQFYISTIANKNSYAYLNEKFFELIFRDMKENILYIEAADDARIVAGSLFFYDEETLYGRYWGTNTYINNLHFEMCYYQGIEYCIQKKLKKFEAGAQGEHKIARGFRPVRTFSAHKIKHPGFQTAIQNFIEEEKKHLAHSVAELTSYLPYKEK